MAVSYELLSTQVPAIIAVGSLIDTTADTPAAPATERITDGETTTGLSKANRNFKRIAAGFQVGGGGGAYHVKRGLTLSTASSLSLPVAAGQASLDDLATLAAAATTALTQGVGRTWIWFTQAGAFSKVIDSTGGRTPPASTGYCYIGSALATDIIPTVDASGVLYLRGGVLWRRTGDLGAPRDTIADGHSADPPSSIYFFNKTQGGTWLWNSEEYLSLDATAADLLERLITLESRADDLDRWFRTLLFLLTDQVGLELTEELTEQMELAEDL